MKLIINADDFGLTKGVNAAIVEAINNGVVMSTTLMVNQLGTADAIDLIHTHKLESIGLHVNLTLGKPVSEPGEVSSLVDGNGEFHSRKYLTDHAEQINAEHVYIEAMNQYLNAKSYGVEIDHFDSHHFAAFLPNLRDGFIKFANEVGLASRRADYYIDDIQALAVKTTDKFSAQFYGERANIKGLKDTILELKGSDKETTVEIMAHPGYSDDELASLSSYTTQREHELSVLLSEEIKIWLQAQEIELIDFKGIK
ncbi:ChbG/HpnK family deacetylase [Photobacterium sp. DNB22_13_2]